jgi:hypothetical protein
MTFWCGSGSGSGSADPCLRLMDPDPDSVRMRIRILIFSSLTFKMPTKKQFFYKSFSAYYFLKVLLNHFSQVKSQKEATKQKKSRFFLLFLLNDRRIRIQEAQKHVDPEDPDPDSDPDPQHWLEG